MNTVELANQLLAAHDAAARLSLPTTTQPGFTMEQAYEVADDIRRLRIARGETPCGYKIGFTNRGIWSRYGVYAPIWGPVWDTTLSFADSADATVSLNGLVQPRLEPEIVFGFARAPRAGMSREDLGACVEWVAHGFEIVNTHFDDWRFQASDTVADFALHGRLIVGPRVAAAQFAALGDELAAIRVKLFRGDVEVEEGRGSNVLDGPLNALRIWVDAMFAQPQRWPIVPGDVVTTGTLTDAWPLVAGQQWHTQLSDKRLSGLHLTVQA